MAYSLAVSLLILSALCAALHRLVIKQSGNRLTLFAGFNAVSVVIGLCAIWFVPPLPLTAVPYLLASSIFYSVAMYFVAKGYEQADFGAITPLQSSIKVILIAILASQVLGDPSSAHRWLAIALLVAGFVIQVASLSALKAQHLSTLALALGAGIFSSLQYIADIAGVRTTGNPLSYVAWNLLIGLPICVYAGWTQFDSLIAQFRRQRSRIYIAACLDVLGYSMILVVVYQLGMLDVLPVINLDILFTTLIGVILLRERFAVRRITASLFFLAAAVLVQVY